MGSGSYDIEPGDAPYVLNGGTTEDIVLKFGIPRGTIGPVGTILASYRTLADVNYSTFFRPYALKVGIYVKWKME